MKKLSREEQKIIREGTDGSRPPLSTWQAVRNFVIIGIIFVLFVMAWYFVVYLTAQGA